MSDKQVQWQDAQVIRDKIVQAQLGLVDSALEQGAVEIEIKCPTMAVYDKLTALGYYYAGENLFRYGAPPEPTPTPKPMLRCSFKLPVLQIIVLLVLFVIVMRK